MPISVALHTNCYKNDNDPASSHNSGVADFPCHSYSLQGMEKTVFEIPKMDCAAEETLVRLKLDGMPAVKDIDFDIAGRRVTVLHEGGLDAIERAVTDLDLGGKRIHTEESEKVRFDEHRGQRKLLWRVLGINAFFFALELLTGFIADSMGLVADSLDMLADALVYALALFAVGGTIARKKAIAKASGYFQLVLAVLGLVEVIRRFSGYGETPAFQTMIVVSLLALVGNSISLYLLRKSENREAHMEASMIFTSNDVIINIGVIVAGVMVFLTSSKLPDLAVGTAVFVIVGRGAYRILQLAK